MKAYVDDSDSIRFFRPDKNMERMNNSMKRLYLPSFDEEAFLECIKELVKVDKDWIPRGEGYSLYMRPTGISSHPFLGVGAAQNAKLYCILSPVGPYYPTGFAPVSLLAGDEYVRAWPGGTGNAKVGGNYGPTIKPQVEAAEKGYSQVCWLFGEDHHITEVGTMNLFFLWKNSDGKTELVTAPLSRGDILPGVTRDSVLQLAREWGDHEVSERNITMAEVVAAVDEGRMIEAFGCGTAAVLSPIQLIHYNGKDLNIPLADGQVGDMCKRLWDEITGIQYGKIDHPWSIRVD
jgi:branched-chain amino acid aminotransferase